MACPCKDVLNLDSLSHGSPFPTIYDKVNSSSVSMSTYGNAIVSGGYVHQGDVKNTYIYNHHITARTDDYDTILNWLSSWSFGEALRRHCNKRTPGTGIWLTEHCLFRSWHACEATQCRILWCRGAPRHRQDNTLVDDGKPLTFPIADNLTVSCLSSTFKARRPPEKQSSIASLIMQDVKSYQQT